MFVKASGFFLMRPLPGALRGEDATKYYSIASGDIFGVDFF